MYSMGTALTCVNNCQKIAQKAVCLEASNTTQQTTLTAAYVKFTLSDQMKNIIDTGVRHK